MSLILTTDEETSLNLHRRYVGSEIPILKSSSGLVFLAFLSPVQCEKYFDFLVQSAPDQTFTERQLQALKQRISEIREQGYGLSPDKGAERSVSIPILHQGQIKGVLLMMYIASGLSDVEIIRDYVPMLKDRAKQIAEMTFIDDDN